MRIDRLVWCVEGLLVNPKKPFFENNAIREVAKQKDDYWLSITEPGGGHE